MPLPTWIVKFWEKHGRDPSPHEIPPEVRRHMRACVRENRANGCWSPEELEEQERMTLVP